MASRGWSIEAPPPEYANGPTQTGRTYEVPNLTPEQSHWICQQAGTFSTAQRGIGVACYVPTLDQVILPAAKYWPSKSELDQMRAHEWAHARGWRHNEDGTGTAASSLPPKGMLALGLTAQPRPQPLATNETRLAQAVAAPR